MYGELADELQLKRGSLSLACNTHLALEEIMFIRMQLNTPKTFINEFIA